MELLYINLEFLYLMLVLSLQPSIMTALFRSFLYNLNVNVIFLSFLLIALNYIRFSILICFNKTSTLMHLSTFLSLVCPIFLITYILSTMVEKCHFLIRIWFLMRNLNKKEKKPCDLFSKVNFKS